MKWGKRKTCSSRPTSISSISPFSWLSKFKRMSINSGPDPAKLKQKVKKHSSSVSSPQYACRNGGNFDDDADFWRLSFRKGGNYNKKNTDILKSLWDNSDDEQNVIPSSSFRKKHGRREGGIKFKDKDTEISMEMVKYDRDMELDQKVHRVLQQQLLKLQRDAEFASTESVEKDSRQRAIREDVLLSTSEKNWNKLKSSSQRLNLKCSFNPQQDFRDSMVEMIKEKEIRQPEEMEELLACYLTLNSDEYHDLIVKVFRQVWHGMNKIVWDISLDKECGSYD